MKRVRHRASRMGVASLAGMAALVVGLTGCASSRPVVEPPKPGRVESEPLDYGPFAARYNERVARLERLWARTTVVIDSVDAEGSPVHEQAEGHLQIERPYRVAITLGKLGDTNLYLGSNEERYWWFDMIDSGAKQAWIGEHAQFTAAKAQKLGIPVHPLDFSTLLGIMPLPETGGKVSRPIVDGEPGSLLMAEVETGLGLVWMWIDEQSMEPARISLLGADRVPVLTADLTRYTPVVVYDDRSIHPHVATRVVVRLRSMEGEIRMTLNEPTNKEIKPMLFDADRLIKGYRIDNVTDLDAQ